MELYDHILKSENIETLAKTNKSILKKEYKVLNRTLTGIFMTMEYGNNTYEKELMDIEDRLNKIDNCLSIAKRK